MKKDKELKINMEFSEVYDFRKSHNKNINEIVERFVRRFEKKLIEEELKKSKITDLHKQNKAIIDNLRIDEDDRFILSQDYKFLKKGRIFSINQIHPFYFWVLFNETEELPQEIVKLLEIGYFIRMKGGLKKWQ